MRVMPTTNVKRKEKEVAHSSRPPRQGLKCRRKKRKLSCSSVEEFVAYSRRKRQKRQGIENDYLYRAVCKTFPRNSCRDENSSEKFVIEEEFGWEEVKPSVLEPPKKNKNDLQKYSIRCNPRLGSNCWINDLPEEILLKIFGYLPLGMLLHIIPRVCKRWEILSLDWTLWKTVEDLTIKNMVISTSKLKTLLRTIPKLKKLELFSRNDTEELLQEVFESHQNLEVLKLDSCYRSTLQMNMPSRTVTSILEFCPKLKTIILIDTYFHSKNFYQCLAKKFPSFERINVTCTSRSEMDVFMENLKDTVSEVQFQKVPMMGRAAGKQIYWGPILGLVVRPIPTSPFHQQCVHDNYPNYAF